MSDILIYVLLLLLNIYFAITNYLSWYEDRSFWGLIGFVINTLGICCLIVLIFVMFFE